MKRECGCGQETRVSTRSRPDRGIRRGDPQRYVLGHSPACQPGPRPDDPRFKGDQAGYFTKHLWLNIHYPKLGECFWCGKQGKTQRALIHGRVYTRDPADYLELCPSCHKWYDNCARAYARLDAERR